MIPPDYNTILLCSFSLKEFLILVAIIKTMFPTPPGASLEGEFPPIAPSEKL